jgi:hypothetical protein
LDHGFRRKPRHQKSADRVDRENALPAFRIGFKEFDPSLVAMPGCASYSLKIE